MNPRQPHRAPLEAARGVEGPPLSADEARGILSESLGMAEADRADAILEAQDHSLTRFANNEIHQNVTARDHALTLRVVVGRRTGVATTHRLDSSALRQLADRALAIARVSPEDPDLPEPAALVAIPPLAAFETETAASTPEARADAVGPVLSAARDAGLNAAGALSTTSALLAVANRGGLFAAQPETYSNFTCTVRSQNSSGWVDRHRRDVRALNVEALGGTVTRLLSELFIAGGGPDFGLVLAGRWLLVAERARWAEGRYLAVDLQLVCERNDTKSGGEIDRALACVSAESLAPLCTTFAPRRSPASRARATHARRPRPRDRCPTAWCSRVETRA